MFRRAGAGPSRASANTLCQKCLQRGHYSYECKTSAQERPYKPRPSRTQQLLNPQLQPKLTTHIPDALVRRTGLADALLSQKEAARRRSRSPSSSSADSVSTISTTRSPSRSPAPSRHKHSARMSSRRRGKAPAKRRRRSASMDSRSSNPERPSERRTRRRMTSLSPDERGRPQSRSRSSRIRSSIEQRAERSERVEREMSTSAACRHMGGERSSYPDSQDRSPSPYSKRVAARWPSCPSPPRNGRQGHDGSRVSARNRFGDEPETTVSRAEFSSVRPDLPQGNRERSLSPFSKRVALTRAMQAG